MGIMEAVRALVVPAPWADISAVSKSAETASSNFCIEIGLMEAERVAHAVSGQWQLWQQPLEKECAALASKVSTSDFRQHTPGNRKRQRPSSRKIAAAEAAKAVFEECCRLKRVRRAVELEQTTPIW